MKVKDIAKIIDEILTSIENLVNSIKKLFKKPKNITIYYIHEKDIHIQSHINRSQ